MDFHYFRSRWPHPHPTLHKRDWCFCLSANAGQQFVYLFFAGEYRLITTLTVSNIIVWGLVPAGSDPPLASYSIDGAPPVAPNLPATTSCVPNQQLFDSGTLSSDAQTLTIIVNQTSSEQPYILDYLWLCKATSDLEGSAPHGNHSHKESHSLSLTAGAIAALVLGGVCLLSIILNVWFCMSRRKKRMIGRGGYFPLQATNII